MRGTGRREDNSRVLMVSKGNWGRKRGNAMKGAIKMCIYQKRKKMYKLQT